MVEAVSTQRKRVMGLLSCGQPLPQDDVPGLSTWLRPAQNPITHTDTPRSALPVCNHLADGRSPGLRLCRLTDPFPEKHPFQWAGCIAPGAVQTYRLQLRGQPGTKARQARTRFPFHSPVCGETITTCVLSPHPAESITTRPHCCLGATRNIHCATRKLRTY